ncbi:MAG: acyl carrier protein [Pseudomonadales bacterium]|nr:acyl carrier protein [Pseudomonadales bacterium]
MNRDEMLQRLQQILEEHFEIEHSKVTPDANLYTDLDLDSIDAVDLVILVQDMIGTKISPEEFKAARTVNDVIAVAEKLLASA